jgi:FAD/FMN-containing dehydrogenase
MKAMKMEPIRLADWSGYTDFGGTAEVYAPKTERQVVDLVRYCGDNQKKLRVVGLQTSWNTLWYTRDVMMTTKYLNRIIEINPENHTITCEAGISLKEVHKALWEKGLTLDTSPAVDWVTVGGAISTGSHGSGTPSMSSSMIGCRLVTANGEVLEINEGDERLDAVRVSMGTLGILVSVTLKVADAFYVYMKRTRILTKDWKRFLTEGEMSYALWFPHTEYTVLATVDVISDPAKVEKKAEGTSSQGFDPNNLEDIERLGVNMNRYSGAVAELANIMPTTFPARNRYLLDVFFQDIEKVGPAHEVLMSFESVPIAGGEWSVPVTRFKAALTDMQAEIDKGDFYLPVVWLKKVTSETAWLSAADEECVQCGIYHHLFEGTPSHVKEMVMRIERLMLKYGGRPHLGKLIYLDPADLKRVYPNWDKFDALRRQMDPQGMFWSEALAASFGN